MQYESDKFCLPAGTSLAQAISIVVKDVAFSISCVWYVALLFNIHVLWLIFDITVQLLVTCASFVKYSRKNGNTMKQCFSYL